VAPSKSNKWLHARTIVPWLDLSTVFSKLILPQPSPHNPITSSLAFCPILLGSTPSKKFWSASSPASLSPLHFGSSFVLGFQWLHLLRVYLGIPTCKIAEKAPWERTTNSTISRTNKVWAVNIPLERAYMGTFPGWISSSGLTHCVGGME
jgi:hypothetical protein